MALGHDFDADQLASLVTGLDGATLEITRGATLDMNFLNVYYDGVLEVHGSIINGTPQFIPEPATVALIAPGALALCRGSRSGRKGGAMPAVGSGKRH